MFYTAEPRQRPCGLFLRFALLFLGLRIFSDITLSLSAAEPLPSSDELTRRIINRSQALVSTNGGPVYKYPKHTLIERLDSSGAPVSSDEKFYEVTLISGIPFNRLLKIAGRELTPAELQTEQERDEKFQQRMSSIDPKKLLASRKGLVSPDLLAHYQFTVSKRIQLNNRTTFVVFFKPKENPEAASSIRDRVLNRVEGTLWVDEQDDEITKVSAHLTETISLGWFGWLGSLSKCEFALDRQRMPDGVWVNLKQAWSIQFRKLTSTTRFRVTETSEDFKRIESK